MAITLADFDKIWASTSPLTPYSFSESNYKQGWNFIGSTPPARQMWDYLQKNNDEKMQYIVNDICVPTEIDETSASGDYYFYPVPNGKVFANMKTLGGKTVAWNQLADPTVTYTTPANTDKTYVFLSNISFVAGHKYIVGRYQQTTLTSNTRNRFQYREAGQGWYYESISGGNEHLQAGRYWWVFTSEITTNGNGDISIWTNNPNTDETNKDFIFCDLTLMFGAGNEPATGEQFEALFPANNYPINAGTLVSAGIKEVIAKDSSNNVVATMPIPSAVQSLEGYGWSAGSVYNDIDFARKKFVKRVGAVDLGTFSWIKTVDGSYGNRFYSLEALSLYKVTAVNVVGNLNCARYVSQSIDYLTNHADSGIGVFTNKAINIRDNSYDDATTFKTAMSGVMLYYELATPVEIDISSILGAVGIACGNTLTFDYDDDYKLPVPVSMDLIDNKYGMMTAQDKAKLDVVYDYIQRVSGN